MGEMKEKWREGGGESRPSMADVESGCGQSTWHNRCDLPQMLTTDHILQGQVGCTHLLEVPVCRLTPMQPGPIFYTTVLHTYTCKNITETIIHLKNIANISGLKNIPN